MQKFWYHSPVRFYRTLEELQDMTNPQNTQYFGEPPVYPLEVMQMHRFLIPNFDNDVPVEEYFIYCGDALISSVCEISDGKLKYVTLGHTDSISGRLEIRNVAGETLFYSNCVRFMDSTDDIGRKFIRIATKHLYNKNLFDYNSPLNWIITSVPAYCLGMTDVDTDLSTSRTGANSTLKIREAYLDEVVQYEVIAKGDANLLNFLQVHVANNQFFIDGTQRTCIEKIDRSEFAMSGKLKFVNVKDSEGLNIVKDFDDMFSDVIIYVLGESNTVLIGVNNEIIQVI